MAKKTIPRCLNCGIGNVRHNSHFCSNKCGTLYADNLLIITDLTYCYVCDKWTAKDNSKIDYLTCGHKNEEQ